MPLQRLTGNGMDYADVVALYSAVDTGTRWHLAAEALGDRNLERAAEAVSAGHAETARSWYLAASCCFRVGQVVLPDDQTKRALFRKMVDAYGSAGDLSNPTIEHVEIPHGDGSIFGWLMP